ncbi:MAG: hypothetical protein S4CHLAM2_02450 [Chlamydiales bacterium]|nr:hypothetical protein [Chlamydiales bacterium]
MDWFGDLIGFLIILLIFLVPLLRKLLVDKKKTEASEEFYEEEEEEELVPPPPPKVARAPPKTEGLVKKDFSFESEVGEREFESQIEERYLETHVDPQFKERIVSDAYIIETQRKRTHRNVIQDVIKKQNPKRAMIILSEILREPKGLS